MNDHGIRKILAAHTGQRSEKWVGQQHWGFGFECRKHCLLLLSLPALTGDMEREWTERPVFDVWDTGAHVYGPVYPRTRM